MEIQEKHFDVYVKKTVKQSNLIKEDKYEWPKIIGHHKFVAINEDSALDMFHSIIPISCLDHFEITIKEVPHG